MFIQDNNLRIREIFSILTQGVEMIQYDCNPQNNKSTVHGRIVWMVRVVYSFYFLLVVESCNSDGRIPIFTEFAWILCDPAWLNERKEKFRLDCTWETFQKSEKDLMHTTSPKTRFHQRTQRIACRLWGLNWLYHLSCHQRSVQLCEYNAHCITFILAAFTVHPRLVSVAVSTISWRYFGGTREAHAEVQVLGEFTASESNGIGGWSSHSLGGRHPGECALGFVVLYAALNSCLWCEHVFFSQVVHHQRAGKIVESVLKFNSKTDNFELHNLYYRFWAVEPQVCLHILSLAVFDLWFLVLLLLCRE